MVNYINYQQGKHRHLLSISLINIYIKKSNKE